MNLRVVLVSVLLIVRGTIWEAGAGAQTDAGQPSPEIIRYRQAADALSKGRNLNKAIADLSLLVRAKPNNAHYHALLGSAYASRFASLACGMEDATLASVGERMYQKRLNIWGQMQNNPNSPLFGTPKPAAPNAPETPDDKKPYHTLGSIVPPNAKPREEEKARSTPAEKEMQPLAKLAQNALQQFDAAKNLSVALSKQERIKISFTRGWGLLLLYRYGIDTVGFEPSTRTAKKEQTPRIPDPNELLKIQQDEIIACFQECTETEPKNPDGWQSLAYAHAPDHARSLDRTINADTFFAPTRNNITQAVASLRKALALKRDKEAVLFQIAAMTAQEQPQESVASLEKFTDADSRKPSAFICWQPRSSGRRKIRKKKTPPNCSVLPFRQWSAAIAPVTTTTFLSFCRFPNGFKRHGIIALFTA